MSATFSSTIAWRWIKYAFAVMALASLVYFAWHSRLVLFQVVANADLLRLLCATCVWLAMHLLAPLFAVNVLRGAGARMDIVMATRIHLENIPARYIPGGVWHTVGRVVGFRAAGVTNRQVSAFVITENTLAVAVAFIMGGSVLFAFRGPHGWGAVAGISALAGIAVVVLLPFVIERFVTLDAHASRTTNWANYLQSVGLVGLSWCIGASAFVLFVSAFPGVGVEGHSLETAAVYLFSWGVGCLAVMAPQGIGVFEVLAGELLGGELALGSLAVLLAGFRAILAVADLLAWSALPLFTNKAGAGDLGSDNV